MAEGNGNNVVAQGRCTDCGAAVLIRRSAKGNLVWFCDGKAPDELQACRASHTFGKVKRAEIEKQIQEHNEHDETAGHIEPEPVSETEPEPKSGGSGLLSGYGFD